MSDQSKLSVRVDDENPNHHLWKNHGTWWVHYTIHTNDYQKERVRKSLGTHDLDEARKRRDQLLSLVA